MTEWKVYRYVMKQSDGVKLLSGPIKRQIDYGHHADVLPAWPLRDGGVQDDSGECA